MGMGWKHGEQKVSFTQTEMRDDFYIQRFENNQIVSHKRKSDLIGECDD